MYRIAIYLVSRDFYKVNCKALKKEEYRSISGVQTLTRSQQRVVSILPIGRYYNPRLCKTCQRLGSLDPRLARTQFSDCEMHYQKRVRKFRRTGVSITSSSNRLRSLVKELLSQ